MSDRHAVVAKERPPALTIEERLAEKQVAELSHNYLKLLYLYF